MSRLGEATATEANPASGHRPGWLGRPVAVWASYDIASSAYYGVVPPLLFPLFYLTVISAGQTRFLNWGAAVSLSLLATAFLAPIIGNAVDRHGHRWIPLLAATVICCSATAGLYFGNAAQPVLTLAIFAVAQCAYLLSAPLYEFLLAVDLATRRDGPRLDLRMGGRLSRRDRHDTADLAVRSRRRGSRKPRSLPAKLPGGRRLVPGHRRASRFLDATDHRPAGAAATTRPHLGLAHLAQLARPPGAVQAPPGFLPDQRWHGDDLGLRGGVLPHELWCHCRATADDPVWSIISSRYRRRWHSASWPIAGATGGQSSCRSRSGRSRFS